jgi:hypothetical protein
MLGEESAVASRRNLIGAMLSPLVQYAPKDYVFANVSGPEYITFELPHELGGKDMRGGAIIISNNNQREFERLLGIYFKDIFFRYVDDKIRYTGEIKKCILMFCGDYNISFNSITYEMLKKSYYRYKKGLATRKILSSKLSLCCPLIFML